MDQPVDPANAYLPRLDSLRAFAVLMVLISHWFEPRVNLGGYGVTLFFVLSGYLITGVIDRLRADYPCGPAAKRFFLRRTLRLCPAYFTLLLIAYWLGSPDIAQWWPRYVAYLSNFHLGLGRSYSMLSSTWSLAMEEQFYLFWFFLAFLLPPRWLKVAIVAMILTAPFVRLVCFWENNEFAMFLPWARWDSLAIGALLYALQIHRRQIPIGAIAALIPAAGLLVANSLDSSSAANWSFSLTLASIVSAGLVWAGTGTRGNAFERIWANPILVYLGKISYGIYLYHMVEKQLAAALGYPHPPGISGFAMHCAGTVSLAVVSSLLLERPLLAKFGRGATATHLPVVVVAGRT